MTDDDREYLQRRALDCQEMADKASTDSERSMWLQMADEFLSRLRQPEPG
jgi:hypothetical protein